MLKYPLDIVASHEHDVVPVSPVHVQVDLPDVGRQPSGSGLQFLEKADLCFSIHVQLCVSTESNSHHHLVPEWETTCTTVHS